MFKLFMLLIILNYQLIAIDRSLVLKEMRTEGRTALIIGNADYEGVPLKNPVNDARAMKEFLLSRNFDVIYGENTSRNKMYDLFDEYVKKVNDKRGVALFYYAGHGVGFDGENFLIPVDARIKNKRDIQRNAFSVSTVLGEISDQKTRLNIVILDACRNNPFKGDRAAGGGLEGVNTNAKGTFIAYATAPGKTANDGDGEHGVYTKNLLNNMSKEGLTIEQVFKGVRRGVEQETSGDQTPWETSSLNGDFFFTLPKEEKKIDVKNALTSISAQEAWKLISGSTSVFSFINFVKLYPDSSYAELAKTRVFDLEKGNVSSPTKVIQKSSDRYFWEDVKNSNNVDSLNAYLTQFPNGAYRALAELKISKLNMADAKFKLFIVTEPEDAKITFANKAYTYEEGMLLVKGEYELIVEKDGYQTYRHLVDLNDNLKVTIPLSKIKKVYPIKIIKNVYASYVEPELKLVNPGKYTIGDSSSNSDDDEKITKEISINYSLYVGTHEVTYAEYDKYTDAKNLKRVNPEAEDRDVFAVTRVSWNDAVEYAKWLSLASGKLYRLPTEAQWEYVARAGSKSLFYWGNDHEQAYDYSVFSGNASDVASIGSKKPNNWGFYDMSGNLWEWCEDSYVDDYANLPIDGSVNPEVGNKKVIRGGAWNSKVMLLRTSNRLWSKAEKGRSSIGFRLVMIP